MERNFMVGRDRFCADSFDLPGDVGGRVLRQRFLRQQCWTDGNRDREEKKRFHGDTIAETAEV
jgi:hypothetical protein